MIVEPFNKISLFFTGGVCKNIFKGGKIGVKGVITGFDYTFGREATGTISDLKEWGGEN